VILERDQLQAMSEQTEPEQPLVCDECGATSPPDAKGWRGYITVHGEAVMFCPACVEREFSDDDSGAV
jgi:rubrerythrin